MTTDNSVTFDELDTLKAIQDLIKETFKTTTWYNLFDKKDLTLAKNSYGKQPTFPCFYVEIMNPIPYAATNNQMENYTVFDFEINHYNKETKAKDKCTIGIMINKKIKETLQLNYGFSIESNMQTPSQDETLYRRTIRGRAVINNITNTLYRV